MEFTLMDRETLEHNASGSDDEGPMKSPRLATVIATFTREFCLVENRGVALDQGLISLTVTNLPRILPRRRSHISEGDEYSVEAETVDDEGKLIEEHHENFNKEMTEEEDDNEERGSFIEFHQRGEDSDDDEFDDNCL